MLKTLLFGLLRGNNARSAAVMVTAMRTSALAVNLCTGLLTAALLGPAGRGVMAALITGPQFLSRVGTFGLHASVVYNIKRDPADEARYLGCTVLLLFGFSLVATLGGWVVLPYYLSQYDAPMVASARLLLLLSPLMVVTPVFGAVLEAHGRFVTATLSIYVSSFTTLIGLAALWWFAALTPVTGALTYLLPIAATLVYTLSRLRPITWPRFSLSPRIVRSLLTYGSHYYGVEVLGAVRAYLDQLMVVVFLAPEQVGAYVVAVSLASVVGVFSSAVLTVLFPSVAARPQNQVLDMVGKAGRFTASINGAAGLVLGVVAPWLIALLYGHSFDAAVLPFRLLVIENLVSSLARILCQAFNGIGRPMIVTWIELIGVAISAAAMLLLMRPYGTAGAAVAVLIGSAARLLVTMVALRMIMRAPVPSLVLGWADIRWAMGR